MKVCFSKQSTSALDAVYEKVCRDNGLALADVLTIYQAKEKHAFLWKKHQLVVGIVRQELRKQNTVTK